MVDFMRYRRKKVIIMGAGGRDFHNFNVFFRDNEEYEVVAFTASQIPGIENRVYPPELAGKLYPKGVPIYPEEKLPELIRKHNVEYVVLSYSDLTHEDVGHIYSKVLAAGASFLILGPEATMIKPRKPVIAVTAVRTGSGKSSVSRKIIRALRSKDVKVAVVRHPMAYGDFLKQKVQVIRTYSDLNRYECTFEEREEYEHYIEMGVTVFAGIDYHEVLKVAEKEADIILWDGGNNDLPFYKPNLHIVVADALRPGQEISTFPGEANVRMADVVVINKVTKASEKNVKTIEENVRKVNPKATIIRASSEIFVDNPELIKGRKAVIVEDGPTVTHGGLCFGAAYVAAKKFGAKIVDPRPYAVGFLKRVYEKYPHLKYVVPTLGYSLDQIKDFEETLNKAPAEIIISSTPFNMANIVKVNKPIINVRYEIKELNRPTIDEVVEKFLNTLKK